MADANPTGREQRGPLSPDPKDKKIERAALAFLIYRHPERLTISELSRILNKENDELDGEDTVERAVRKLVGAGLLECRDKFVLPTRAVLYFDALDSD
jgi:hypothetical protein